MHTLYLYIHYTLHTHTIYPTPTYIALTPPSLLPNRSYYFFSLSSLYNTTLTTVLSPVFHYKYAYCLDIVRDSVY